MEERPLGFLLMATMVSVQKMFRANADFAAFTAQTDHHEPNLSFHFANALWAYLRWLNCDFDVKKPEQHKRPDIIFHRRGTHDDNYLVVEVKRRNSRDVVDWECHSDEEKIREYWQAPPLNYRYGLSLILDELSGNFAFSLQERVTGGCYRLEEIHFDDQRIDYAGLEPSLMAVADKGLTARDRNFVYAQREFEYFMDRDFGFLFTS